MVETEIYCHECNRYFRFDWDVTKNGNHVVKCPGCGHEHCRVIENGRVTSTRWDSRNGVTYRYLGTSTTGSGSKFQFYTGGSTATADDNYPGAWTEGRSI